MLHYIAALGERKLNICGESCLGQANKWMHSEIKKVAFYESGAPPVVWLKIAGHHLSLTDN